MNKKLLFFLLMVFISPYIIMINGCGDGKTTQKDSTVLEESKDPTVLKFSGRLFSVPSPLQISMLVKESNIPYNKELLNPTTKQPNYSTNFKQALNLGVYGANLGYLNTYEQLPELSAYFAVIKLLAKDLGLLNSFNESAIKRLEANKNNKDSLLYILSNVFREADAFLLNNQRNQSGVLILAGGWIESLYLITQTLKIKSSQVLIDRIGEQKRPLENLIELLRPYYGKESDEFDKLLEQLVDLATIFDGVVIEYTYEKPTIDVANKISTINSKSKTIITDYQLKTITESISNLRKKIVN
jgi:hypothetical protein